MKKVLSIWMAAAKNLWWKLLAILVLLFLAEYGLYRYAVSWLQSQSEIFIMLTFPVIVEKGRLKLLFLAAVVAVAACCCLQGSRFSGKNYTLQRLPMAEWRVTALWAAVHLACFLILWAAQLLTIFLLWKLYLAEFPSAAPGLELLVSFYGNGFLHAMLPLADFIRWIYLGVYWLCISWVTACFGFFQRRGTYRISLLFLLGCYFTLTVEMGSIGSSIISAIVCLLVAVIDAQGMWGVYHEAQPN